MSEKHVSVVTNYAFFLCRKMQKRKKEKQEDTQTIEQIMLGLFNEGEGSARKSDAQPCIVACLLIEMSL